MKNLFFIVSLGFLFTMYPNLHLNAQASWILTDYNGQKTIESGQVLYLKANINGYHLAYKQRKFGINLGWGKTKKPNITLVSQSGGKIKVGDKIAIKVEGGDYLKYGERRWGINLVWSKVPVFEWELRNSKNQKGEELKTEDLVGLYNAHVKCKDFVGYCERKASPTVNLAWAADCQNGIRWPEGINSISKGDLVKIGLFALPLIGILK